MTMQMVKGMVCLISKDCFRAWVVHEVDIRTESSHMDAETNALVGRYRVD